MKIILIEGSGRGQGSSSLYFARRLMSTADKSLRFEILEVGKYIKVLAENRDFFDSYLKAMQESDAVIWLVPVRNLLPCYEICHFLSLIDSRNAGERLENKYTTALFTSSFFSHREAEEYLAAACQTWDMNYIRGFHCRPDAAINENGTDKWLRFADAFFGKVRLRFPCEKFYSLSRERSLPFKPVETASVPKKSTEKKILILTAGSGKNPNLKKMIDTWKRYFPYETETVNLSDLSLCFPCSGCMNCFRDRKCSGNDNISKTVYPKYRDADAVIFASEICFGLFEPQIKLFLDRIFIPAYFDRNRPKETVYLFSGSLKNKFSLEKYIHHKSILHGERTVGIIGDDEKSARQITANIAGLAKATAGRLESVHRPEPESDSEAEFRKRFERTLLLPPSKPFFLFRNSVCLAPVRVPLKLKIQILKIRIRSYFRKNEQERKHLYLQALDHLLSKTETKSLPRGKGSAR